jgi:hypothetical protein
VSHSAVRSTLVITQITVCSALLSTAAVLVRSQKAPEPPDRGFSASHVVLAHLNFDDRADKREFYDKLLPRLERSPGIVSASVAQTGPIPGQLDDGGSIGLLRVHGDASSREFEVQTNYILAGYFRTIGVPFVDGRDFNSYDRVGTPAVGIVNETLAHELSPGGNPVGSSLRLTDGSRIQIVGVAHNFKYAADQKVETFLYRPLAQQQNIYVRSERAGQRVMESVKRFITKKLKLKVNEAKSAVARPQQRKFLGFSFSDGPEVKRIIAPKALDRFKHRIREITRRAKGVSIAETIAELAPYMRGWRSYFGFCETPEVLIYLTRWVRLRLRAALWRQWKTPRRRLEALLALGVRPRLARNTAGSGLGPWYLARAKALSVGLSNAYFKSLGLPTLIDEVTA